jgi:hypothetical protein
MLCAIVCLLLSNYQANISGDPILSLIFKDIDTSAILLLPVFQIVRGFVIGLVVYQFHSVIIYEDFGWFKLFMLLFIIGGVGSSIIGLGSIEGYIYSNLGFYSPIMGLFQIFIYQFLTSLIFTKWIKKNVSKTRFYSRY